MCTMKDLDCVTSIQTVNSECLEGCSGVQVISYDKENMYKRSDIRFQKLVKYLERNVKGVSDMANDFKGSFLHP